MAGNVWEWVQGNILKGGGFFSSKEDLKIKSYKPGNSDKEGFRCIKVER
jgi:formylglycine-generating enzyme required for sulfatase activity